MLYVIILLGISVIVITSALYINREDFKKDTKSSIHSKIYFNNNKAAYEYALTHWSPNWEVGCIYVGLIVDYIDESHVSIQLVANNEPDILAIAFVGHCNFKFSKGNLIYWVLTASVDFPDLGKISPAGVIIATIEPCLNLNTNEWEIRKYFKYNFN